jgi:uncharacterized RDD family membrane protein YckC
MFRQQCQWIQRFLTSLVFSFILLLSPAILLANVSKPLSTAIALAWAGRFWGKRRALHDFIAGSAVIRRPNKSLQATPKAFGAAPVSCD